MGRPQPATVLSVIAVVLAAGGGAVAAIPNDDGSVTACYVKGSGELRVISSGACETDEARIALGKPWREVPAARAYDHGIQRFDANTTTAVPLEDEDVDTFGMHFQPDEGGHDPRLAYVIAPRTGIYRVDASALLELQQDQPGVLDVNLGHADGERKALLWHTRAEGRGNRIVFSRLVHMNVQERVYFEVHSGPRRASVIDASLGLAYVSDAD